MKTLLLCVLALCFIPEIIPATVSAAVGSQVTFTGSATGTAPIAWQFYKAGVPIPGATTNPFVIQSVALTDAGDYSATAANVAGSTTAPAATLVVTAVPPPVSYAPDLSKQFAEVTLATATYSPPVAQFPQFAIIPASAIVSDPGSHMTANPGFYTVGKGEGGFYAISIVVRSVDNPGPLVGVGLTAGTDNLDNRTHWYTTPPATTNYIHWGADPTIQRSFADGDQIRANVFVQSALQFISVDVVIRRLY